MLNLSYGYNLFKAFYSYHHGIIKLDYPPVLGSIETSSVCNLNCTMCAMDQVKREKGIMTPETFKNIIRPENRKTIRTVDFTGHGEPLLNWRLEEFIHLIRPYSKKIGVTTNGLALSKKRSKQLLESGLDFICFSFEDVNKEVYESIRVGSDYGRVKKNIFNFIELKRGMDSNCKTYLIVVDSPLTHNHLKRIKIIWKSLVDEILILPVHDWGGVLDSRLVNKSNIFRSIPCFSPFYHVYIRWDGSVVPCCVWEGKMDFGNINEQSIMEIWNSEVYQDFRESLLFNPVDHCRFCHLNMLGDVFPLGKPEPTFPFSKSSFALLRSGINRALR